MWIKNRKLVVTNLRISYMIPFLYRIAQTFYQRYGTGISRLAFVFPNRRSGVFFQKYLAEVSDKPLFSPRVITINDLMTELSPYTPIDRISLLVTLYKQYVALRKSDETFDSFVFWGDMLSRKRVDIDVPNASFMGKKKNVVDSHRSEKASKKQPDIPQNKKLQSIEYLDESKSSQYEFLRVPKGMKAKGRAVIKVETDE